VWTLALRGGARVAVDAAEWCDAFGVVTCGGCSWSCATASPGPVLGRDAGFWLRGTGVRALRNPVTGVLSVVGIVIAAALLRWSARPAERFVWTAVSLTAISLVPPLLSGANTATTTALLGLHLVPATVMIPTLARSLRTRTD
jgi:Family of unknown function (DUF6069)